MTTPNSQPPTPKRFRNGGTLGGSKPYDIRERTFLFALRVLQIAGSLPREHQSWMIGGQLARSGTSIGANTEEADGADSKADKRRSLRIARKEAREARYWLRIVDRMWGKSIRVEADVAEATEIVRILSAIILKLE